MLSLDIDIASPGFLHDFQTVQIEGLTYTFRLDASAGDVSLLSITVHFATIMAAHLFAQWLHEYLVQKRPDKASINNIDVSQNPGQVNIIINQQIHYHQGDISNQEQP